MAVGRALKAMGLIGAGALAGVAVSRFLETDAAPVPASLKLPGSLPNVLPLVTPTIRVDHATKIVAQLNQLEGQRVLLLIHTLGGSFMPVVQIARALRRHSQAVAFVPFHALSGGTLVALATQQLYMWPDASLGPIDPQIGPYSASALLGIRDQKPLGTIDDHTLALAHEAEKALAETTTMTREFVDTETAVTRLVAGKTPHSFPISFEEAERIGLNVRLAPQSPMTWALVRKHMRGGGGCTCQM